ncbi:MAG TPA: enoyl-CoA hydratase-related protein [Myxococcota bacterium]|nr:enoyl-CoA hydratase-related protein [Myxococcota bacterium]
MYREIQYDVEGSSAVIQLNRPDRLNALTHRMLSELRHAIAAAEEDARVVGIVLTGAGRGFSAGMDAQALAAGARGEGNLRASDNEFGIEPGDPKIGTEFSVTYAYLLRVQKPVIAAINGPCAGLGLAIAALCDLRFASESAVFRTAFAQRGLIAEHGSSWILPRLLGPSRALDLLWHPRKVDAKEALALGLVNRVVPDAELLREAKAYIDEIATWSSPASIKEMKQQVYRALMQPLDVAMNEANARMAASFQRKDFAEGVGSFLENRKPAFPRIGKS